MSDVLLVFLLFSVKNVVNFVRKIRLTECAGTSSVPARQYRVTVDFPLGDAGPRAPSVHPHNLPLRGTQRQRD